MASKDDFSTSNPRRDFVIRWGGISSVLIVFGLIIGWLVSQPIFCRRTVFTDLVGAMLFGSVLGAIIGLGQYKQMKDQVKLPQGWIYANIIGWMIALLLLEFYVPIARCMASSNAPVYSNSWANNSYYQFSLFAEQIEKLIYREVLHGETYQLIAYILHTSMMGLLLGFPQGITQWLALRRYFTRSPIMIVSNIFAWLIGISGGLYLGGVQKWALLGIIWALMLPPAIIAWTLVTLKPRR